MEFLQRVRKTDLARNTHQVIREVQRGQTAVVESHGQPEVAIIDITDYYLQRAAIHYYARSPHISKDGLMDDQVVAETDEQKRYDLVIAHYLAGSISLGRTAELLGLPWLDLRGRFLRLGIPVRVAPQDAEELRQELEAFR